MGKKKKTGISQKQCRWSMRADSTRSQGDENKTKRSYFSHANIRQIIANVGQRVGKQVQMALVGVKIVKFLFLEGCWGSINNFNV